MGPSKGNPSGVPGRIPAQLSVIESRQAPARPPRSVKEFVDALRRNSFVESVRFDGRADEQPPVSARHEINARNPGRPLYEPDRNRQGDHLSFHGFDRRDAGVREARKLRSPGAARIDHGARADKSSIGPHAKYATRIALHGDPGAPLQMHAVLHMRRPAPVPGADCRRILQPSSTGRRAARRPTTAPRQARSRDRASRNRHRALGARAHALAALQDHPTQKRHRERRKPKPRIDAARSRTRRTNAGYSSSDAAQSASKASSCNALGIRREHPGTGPGRRATRLAPIVKPHAILRVPRARRRSPAQSILPRRR